MLSNWGPNCYAVENLFKLGDSVTP